MRLAFLLLALCFTAFGQTVDLDAPAVKKVTIRSEMQRGRSAIFDCRMEGRPTDMIKATDCPFKIIELNKQKNTDTDAFLLGVYMGAWMGIETILGVIEKLPDREARNYSLGVQNAELWFKMFKTKEKELGLDDATVCSVCELNYTNLKPRMDLWASRMK